MKGFIDIHAHFVYGVDDGAQSREDMEALLDAAYKDRILSLTATPHMVPGVKPFDGERFALHLEEAREYCRKMGYPLRLFAGAELMYTPALEMYMTNHRLPTYEGSARVLMEFVPDTPFAEMDRALTALELGGYEVTLAHVERYRCLALGGARRLKKRHDGLRYQMNCGAVLGGGGFLRRFRVRRWLKKRLIDAIASDMHSVKRRPPRMAAACRRLVKEVGTSEAGRLMGMHEREE